jgi:hypothetical protein
MDDPIADVNPRVLIRDGDSSVGRITSGLDIDLYGVDADVFPEEYVESIDAVGITETTPLFVPEPFLARLVNKETYLPSNKKEKKTADGADLSLLGEEVLSHHPLMVKHATGQPSGSSGKRSLVDMSNPPLELHHVINEFKTSLAFLEVLRSTAMDDSTLLAQRFLHLFTYSFYRNQGKLRVI